MMDFDDIKVELSDDSDDSDNDNNEVNNNDIMCGDCGRHVKNDKCLKGHIRRFHEKMICPTCGIECTGSRRYKNHQRSHQSVPCTKCNKSFSPDNIKRHIKLCKGIPSPKYNCENCDFSTNVKKQLERFVIKARIYLQTSFESNNVKLFSNKIRKTSSFAHFLHLNKS